MDAEKIARTMAEKAGGKVLRFRETDAQVIVLLTDGRKLYHSKTEPEPKASVIALAGGRLSSGSEAIAEHPERQQSRSSKPK
jgi:hypothetical protein